MISFKRILKESLKPNFLKFERLLSLELEKHGDKDIFDFELQDEMTGQVRVYSSKIIKHLGGKQIIIDFCNRCGLQPSFHRSDVWITPKDSLPKEFDEYDDVEYKGDSVVLWHWSNANNLDKIGIRPRSRLKDKEFDVYENRVYCFFNEESADHFASMMKNEHGVKKEFYLYRLLIPKSWTFHQDPTVDDAVYLDNKIPPKFIEKIKKF